MTTKKLPLIALTLITAGAATVALGQNVYEQSRTGTSTGGTSSADWALNGFSTTISSLHSSAPGQPGGDSSSRFAGAPVSTSANFTVSPNNTSSQLNIGTTYVVAVTWPNNTTANQIESPDILVTASDSGMSGIDTFAGLTAVFKQGTIAAPNIWMTVGLVTVNGSTPTFTFTGAGGTTTDRWYADAMEFIPVANLPTAQYWDTGSLGGSGTWNTTTPNWVPNSDGSGGSQNYVQGNLVVFSGASGTVSIDPVNGVTTDGGLLFATNGYVLQSGPLTLGLGTNIIVMGTNVATINSALTGTNGLCTFGGSGTLILGATNVIGAVSPTAGILQLTANSTFSSLGGSLGGGILALLNYTLTVGDSTTNYCGSLITDTSATSQGSLIKQGSGTLELTAANTFHGTTTINDGILAITADGSLGTAPSALVANQLTLNGNGATLFGENIMTINAKRGITLNGPSNYISMPHALDITLNCPITGNGSLIVPSAEIDFNATNTYTGNLLFTTTNNISVRFNTNNSAGYGKIIVTPLTAAGTAFTIRNLAPAGITTTITNAIELNPGGQNYNIDTAGSAGTFILTGNIDGAASGVNINDNGNGQGTVVLSGNNSAFSGGFNLEGGTLSLGNANALGSGPFQIESVGNANYKIQATLPLTGASSVTNSVYVNVGTPITIQGANPIELSGPMTMAANVDIEVTDTAGAVLSGVINDQGQGLSLNVNANGSTGTLTLGGADAYTGGTTVTAGTLDVNATGSIIGNVTVNGGVLELDNASSMPSPSVTINSGTVFLNYSGTQNIGALTLGGVPAANGTWGASGSGAANISAFFTGTGILNVGSSSTTVVTQASGPNPYTYGSALTFTAAVTGSSPTGFVQFYANGVPLGSPVALASASATSISINNLGVATLLSTSASVTANYLGDVNNGPSFGNLMLPVTPLPAILQETYNGSTTAAVANLSVANVVGSDVVPLTGGPLILASAAAGVESITSGTVSSSNPNYAAASATTVTVNPRPVDLTGTRAYDGTGTASASILSVANAVVGDDVTVNPTSGNVTLASASVGSEAITSFGAISLLGTTAPDYTLTGASGAVVITNSFNAFMITNTFLDATKTNLVVCWQSTPGVVYHILTNTGLGNNTWADVGSPASPTIAAPTNSFCATIPGATNTNTFVLIKQ